MRLTDTETAHGHEFVIVASTITTADGVTLVGAHAHVDGYEADPDAYAYNSDLRPLRSGETELDAVLSEYRRAFRAIYDDAGDRAAWYVTEEEFDEAGFAAEQEAELAAAREREARAEYAYHRDEAIYGPSDGPW